MTEKKRALITGATGGIGAAIAKKLAERYHVILHTNSNIEKANTLLNDIQSLNGSAEVCQFNLADKQQTADVLESLAEGGPIQIIVNNAGFHEDVPFVGMEQTAWDKVLDINLNSFYHVTKPLLLPMMSTRWGRIISISSIAGLTGNRGQVNYSAAKAGLHGASKSLAIELASRHITVNVVAPGVIDTEMAQDNFDEQRIKQMIPMGRAGKPDEVAALVAFLASDDAAYISGQIISINGAMF